MRWLILLLLVAAIFWAGIQLSTSEATLTPSPSEDLGAAPSQTLISANTLPPSSLSTLTPGSVQDGEYGEEDVDSAIPCEPWPWCENATETAQSP